MLMASFLPERAYLTSKKAVIIHESFEKSLRITKKKFRAYLVQ
jgi:hypothetical protein